MIPRDPPHFLQIRLAVRRHLREYPLTQVVAGVSGGPDSLALAFGLIAEGVDVLAVSVDHGMQPGSAEVSRRALSQLPVPGEIVSIQATSEADAREQRYAALLSFGRPVAVAHTAEDQAETLLLGALRGLAVGMPPAGRVHRPLLGTRRADTLGACRELGLATWADPQNEELRFRRVAVRTQIIPQLSEMSGGDIIPALATAATRLAEDEAALRELARPSDDCAVLAAYPAALRRRAIAAWLHERGLRPTGASLSAIAALCTNWHGQGPVAVGGAQVIRRAGRLELRH